MSYVIWQRLPFEFANNYQFLEVGKLDATVFVVLDQRIILNRFA